MTRQEIYKDATRKLVAVLTNKESTWQEKQTALDEWKKARKNL